MKTLGEFIQRLQADPAFEKQAQAFDNGDELMAFVKRARATTSPWNS